MTLTSEVGSVENIELAQIVLGGDRESMEGTHRGLRFDSVGSVTAKKLDEEVSNEVVALNFVRLGGPEHGMVDLGDRTAGRSGRRRHHTRRRRPRTQERVVSACVASSYIRYWSERQAGQRKQTNPGPGRGGQSL